MQGGIPIGASRTATEIVYNVSKKTPLKLTSISIVGPDAVDFTIPATVVQEALSNPIPPNKGQGIPLAVTFMPTAAGTRTATLTLVSNAGTAKASLTGTALPNKPIISPTGGALGFLPDSAFDTVTVSNSGGQGLVLQSIAITGTNPASFQFYAANRGFGNCYAGVEIGAHSLCFIGIGVAPGAPVPSSASLTIVSNDPAHPRVEVGLALTH